MAAGCKTVFPDPTNSAPQCGTARPLAGYGHHEVGSGCTDACAAVQEAKKLGL